MSGHGGAGDGNDLWPVKRPPLAQGLRLVTTAQEYILVDSQRNAIYLHRNQIPECVISSTSSTGGDTTPWGTDGVPIFGVLGVVELFSGPYLLAVTQADRVGRLAGQHDVFRLRPAGVEVWSLPCASPCHASLPPAYPALPPCPQHQYMRAHCNGGMDQKSLTQLVVHTGRPHCRNPRACLHTAHHPARRSICRSPPRLPTRSARPGTRRSERTSTCSAGSSRRTGYTLATPST